MKVIFKRSIIDMIAEKIFHARRNNPGREIEKILLTTEEATEFSREYCYKRFYKECSFSKVFTKAVKVVPQYGSYLGDVQDIPVYCSKDA